MLVHIFAYDVCPLTLVVVVCVWVVSTSDLLSVVVVSDTLVESCLHAALRVGVAATASGGLAFLEFCWDGCWSRDGADCEEQSCTDEGELHLELVRVAGMNGLEVELSAATRSKRWNGMIYLYLFLCR